MNMFIEYREYHAYCKRVDLNPCSYAEFIAAYKIDPLIEGYWNGFWR